MSKISENVGQMKVVGKPGKSLSHFDNQDNILHIVPRSIFGRSRTGRGLMKLTYHAWQHFSMMADHGANACFVFCIPALSNLLSCPVVILHSAPLELLVGFF